jgi:hypothetical protein
MGTQLRLVETPPVAPARHRRANAGRRAQPARRARRTVHWPDWRLDDRARRIGREGVAQARAALAQSQAAADPKAPLSKAS